MEIDEIRNLPLLPTGIREAILGAIDEKVTAEILATRLIKDQALESRILKVANRYEPEMQVGMTSVLEVAERLGEETFRDMVVAVSLFGVFGVSATGSLDPKLFWEHSLACAWLSQALVALHGADGAARMFFLAGLLHDCGRLFLNEWFPRQLAFLAEKTRSEQTPLFELESALLGCSHSELGYWMAINWGLPEMVGDAVYYHHSPGPESEHRMRGAPVHVADHLCHLRGIGHSGNESIPILKMGILDLMGMTAEKCYAVLDGLSGAMVKLSRFLGYFQHD